MIHVRCDRRLLLIWQIGANYTIIVTPFDMGDNGTRGYATRKKYQRRKVWQWELLSTNLTFWSLNPANYGFQISELSLEKIQTRQHSTNATELQ